MLPVWPSLQFENSSCIYRVMTKARVPPYMFVTLRIMHQEFCAKGRVMLGFLSLNSPGNASIAQEQTDVQSVLRELILNSDWGNAAYAGCACGEKMAQGETGKNQAWIFKARSSKGNSSVVFVVVQQRECDGRHNSA